MHTATQQESSDARPSTPPRSSRRRYRDFVQAYKARRPRDPVEASRDPKAPQVPRPGREKRREYLRDYMRWLWPHRYAIAGVFLFAILSAGLEMIEPLFMRFIIDRVLLRAG